MTDQFDERADDVRVLLETAHVPPARADLARAMVAGTVVRRRRRYAAVAAATLFAVAGTAVVGQALERTGTRDRLDAPIGETVTSTPAPFSACTVSALPVPHGGSVLTGQVVADPTGRYAAASLVQPDGTIRPVLWTDGEPAVLPPAGDGAQPSAVNSAGVVVGTASGRDGRPLAWIYRDGRVSRLGAVPGYEWWAPVSVDEHGAVTGEAWRGLRFAVVSWPSAASRGAVVRVTEPRGVRGSGVGAGGVVVGTWGDGAAPYAWRADGTGRALRLPRGAATGQPVAVRGAWAAGWVGLHPATVPPEPAAAPREQGGEKDMRLREMLGKPGAGKLVVAPARWNLSTGEVTHWPERTVAATAVNAAGWVVVPGDGGAAVVSPEGRMTALPGPADGYPTTLSDDNRRLYGERFPHGAEGDPFAEALAAKRLAKGVVTELLMWSC